MLIQEIWRRKYSSTLYHEPEKISYLTSRICLILAHSKVILFVGVNDASNGTDMEYFEELNYEQVIINLEQANDTCQIYLCEIAHKIRL